MKAKIVTDSTAYLDPAEREALDLSVVPLSVHFPDESALETDIDADYFYNRIEREGIIPTSSQPSPGQIYAVFAGLVRQGYEVLGIFISSAMSGTYESAIKASEMVKEEIPGAKIEVLDSRTNCMALGLIVLEAARAAAAGLSLEEIMPGTEKMIKRVRFYFVPANLEYLKKGGRIGGASALIGSVLNIKPVLWVEEGTTQVFKKVRGLSNALETILRVLEDEKQKVGIGEIIVHYIHHDEKAVELARTIHERLEIKARVMPIGPVIGLHVGPGAVGIVFNTIE